MFCHDRYSLLFVFEKKQHDHINSCEETMGETRGRREKRLIACTMIEYAAATTGEKMASICGCVWWMGNSSDAFAAVPCLTPLCRTLLHISEHHQMLAFSLSAVSLKPRQEGRRAGIMRLSHSRRRTAERSCLMKDTR
jgi:hypothetical protein